MHADAERRTADAVTSGKRRGRVACGQGDGAGPAAAGAVALAERVLAFRDTVTSVKRFLHGRASVTTTWATNGRREVATA